jgi:hypothetical protein
LQQLAALAEYFDQGHDLCSERVDEVWMVVDHFLILSVQTVLNDRLRFMPIHTTFEALLRSIRSKRFAAIWTWLPDFPHQVLRNVKTRVDPCFAVCKTSPRFFPQSFDRLDGPAVCDQCNHLGLYIV